jgi:hypothetical protein
MTLDFSIRIAATLTGMSRKTIETIVAPLPEGTTVEQLIAAFVAYVRAETPVAHLPANLKQDPNLPKGVHSKLALSEMFEVDRATITKRFRKEGITPAYEKAKFKGYRLEQKGKTGLTVKQLLESDEDPKLLEARIRNLEAQTRNKDLDYQERTGQIEADLLSEFRDAATRFVKGLHTRLVKRYWRENAKRLRRCKSDADLQRTGETDQSLIFDEIKREYPRMFEG